MKTKLIIVRHAEAVGNRIREFHGWTDESITDRGHKQAEQVADRLRNTPMDGIYSSTLKRTMETASYISKAKKLPISPRDDLKEINGGLWEKMPWDNLAEKYPDEYETWESRPHLHQMPEGESMVGFQKRVASAVSDILRKEEGKSICIVTHGTVIRALLCWFKGFPLQDMVRIQWCDNTAVTIVTREREVFTVELEGDNSHLDDKTSTLKNQEWFLEYKKKFFEQRKS